MVLFQLWKSVDWCKAALLTLASLVRIAPGIWLTRRLSEPVLPILICGLVIAALIAVMTNDRARVFKGLTGSAAAGLSSGFMNTTAGVGGPPTALYQLSTDRAQEPYVATVQVYFIGLNIASLFGGGAPDLDTTTWTAAIAALSGGLLLGDRLARRVTDGQAGVTIILPL